MKLTQDVGRGRVGMESQLAVSFVQQCVLSRMMGYLVTGRFVLHQSVCLLRYSRWHVLLLHASLPTAVYE